MFTGVYNLNEIGYIYIYKGYRYRERGIFKGYRWFGELRVGAYSVFKLCFFGCFCEGGRGGEYVYSLG